MLISRMLKDKNIAEYLLYQWQVEDILRAYDLDLDKVRANWISKLGVKEEDEKEVENWYAARIRMMREEGVCQKGHLQINKIALAQLTDLHLRLLRSNRFPDYTAAYYKALPFIVELRRKSGGEDIPELECCLNALYGVMMLRLQHKEVSKGTESATADIAKLLSLLAEYFKKDEANELEF